MGTWSLEAFGNDTACDWASALEDEKGYDFILETLDKVEDDDKYLEADLGMEIVASCEALAQALGSGTQVDEELPEEVEAWLEGLKDTPPIEVLQQAQKALDHVLDEHSELRQLWEESDEYQEWEISVLRIKRALSPEV